MSAKVLVIGLDGADWAIAEPLMAAGALPNLAALRARGAHAVLESTVPPVTWPAWTTFLTGVGPGRHGVLDFTRWTPGRYGVRFASARSRAVPTVLERLADTGRKVAALGFPGTWPAPRLPGGFVLSGFDAPLALGPGPGAAQPPATYARLARRHGPWVYADIDELQVGEGWHEPALGRLRAGLARKGRIATDLLTRERWDLFAVHLGETDTVGHHFMAHHDPGSPRRPAEVPAVLAGAVAAIYRDADAIVGALLRAAGEGAMVLVASDHGMTAASDRVLHLNRALATGGLLAFAEPAGAKLSGGARDLALRHLPGRLKELLFRRLGAVPSRLESRRRFGGLDLGRSVAFSEELTYAPSVRLNVRGRDPLGVVAPEDVDAARQTVTDLLLGLRDPETGEPVVGAVRPREAVLSGPALEEAPDLYIEPAAPGGYPYTVLPSRGPGPWRTRLEGEARLGGKGRGPTGVHRGDGVLVFSAEDGPRGDLGRVPIGAAAATLLAAFGLESDEVEYPSILGRGVAAREAAAGGNGDLPLSKARDYTADEEAQMAERLRALGYID